MYSFSGLCGVPEKPVAIILEYKDMDQGKHLRLTLDVRSIENAQLEVSEKAKYIAGIES